MLQAAGLWLGEFAYVEEMLDRDVRNNSAWNQRFFVLKNMLEKGLGSSSPTTSVAAVMPMEDSSDGCWGGSGGGAGPCGSDLGGAPEGAAAAGAISSSMRRAYEEAIGRELRYVASKIGLAPRNESCWNYLLGLFSALPGCLSHELARWPQVT